MVVGTDSKACAKQIRDHISAIDHTLLSLCHVDTVVDPHTILADHDNHAIADLAKRCVCHTTVVLELDEVIRHSIVASAGSLEVAVCFWYSSRRAVLCRAQGQNLFPLRACGNVVDRHDGSLGCPMHCLECTFPQRQRWRRRIAATVLHHRLKHANDLPVAEVVVVQIAAKVALITAGGLAYRSSKISLLCRAVLLRQLTEAWAHHDLMRTFWAP